MKFIVKQTFEQGMPKKLGPALRLEKDAAIACEEVKENDVVVGYRLEGRPVPKRIVDKIVALGYAELRAD